MIGVRTTVERVTDFKVLTQEDWQEMGSEIAASIVEDLSQGVKPSTGRRMPRYRDPERSGVERQARITLYRTGALYRSFRVLAREDGVRIESGHNGAFYAWILDRRLRFMVVPKNFGPTAVELIEAALGHNLATRKVKVRRRRVRKTKREVFQAKARRHDREVRRRARDAAKREGQ